MGNIQTHKFAIFCGVNIKRKPVEMLNFNGFHNFAFLQSGATSTIILVSLWLF